MLAPLSSTVGISSVLYLFGNGYSLNWKGICLLITTTINDHNGRWMALMASGP